MALLKEKCNILHVDITVLFSSQKGHHLYAVYNGLEATLSDSKKKYEDKVFALLSAWEHVSSFAATASVEESDALISWAYRHTLKLVFHGDWPKLMPVTKTHLSVTLKRCLKNLEKKVGHGAPQCQLLIRLVQNPWGHPIINQIMNMNSVVDEAALLELCQVEQGVALSVRIETLCESRCEDLALKLAEAIHQCLRLSGACVWGENGDEQYFHTVDMYIALLYKFGRILDIIKEFKQVQLEDGLKLVRRYVIKAGKCAKIWKESEKVVELAATYFLTNAMLKPISEAGTLLQALMTEWVDVYYKLPDFSQTVPTIVRKVIHAAESARHLYMFSQVLEDKFGSQLKSLYIELYIRGLTYDMNELEQCKLNKEKTTIHEIEVRLADGFLKLANLLKDNVGVCRECILTAFSLNPTEDNYKMMEEMAVASGKLTRTSPQGESQDMRCVPSSEVIMEGSSAMDCIRKRNECDCSPPPDPNSDALGKLCPKCGDFTSNESLALESRKKKERTLDAMILITGNTITESLNYNEFSAPSQVLDAETLGLTPQICSDLAVVLSSPRYQVLSWVLDWDELSVLCTKYMENKEVLRNGISELKYLHIDYNQFRNWPINDRDQDEYNGIEKGYEQWLLPFDDAPYETNKRLVDNSSACSLPLRQVRKKPRKTDSSESNCDPGFQKKEKSKNSFQTQSLPMSGWDIDMQEMRINCLENNNYRVEEFNFPGNDDCRVEKLNCSGINDSKLEKLEKYKHNSSKLHSSSKRKDSEKLNNISSLQVMLNQDATKLNEVSHFQRNLDEIAEKLNNDSLSQNISSKESRKINYVSPSQVTSNKEMEKTSYVSPSQLRSEVTKNMNSTSHFQIMNDSLNQASLTSDVRNNAVMNIVPETTYDPKNVRSLLLNSSLPVHSNGRDPKILNPLRLYRHKMNCNKKGDQKINNVSYLKTASTQSSNPYSYDKKARPINPVSHMLPKIVLRKLPHNVNGKSKISHPCSSVHNTKSDLVAEIVPKSNTVDMIMLPQGISMHIIQFPMSSTSDISLGNSCHQTRTTYYQNIQNMDNSFSGTMFQEHEPSSNISSVSAHPQILVVNCSETTKRQLEVTTAKTSGQTSNNLCLSNPSV